MSTDRPRAQFEDYLRAVAYLALGVWAVAFAVYPSVSYVSALAVIVRFIWMGFVVGGVLLAIVGSLLRIDIKMEMPGIIFFLVGPILYTATRIFFALDPVDHIPGVTGLNSTPTAIYAVLPVLFTLPRLYGLYAESRRLKRINTKPKEI